MTRTEKTVFISYRRADLYPAMLIYKDLTQHGYDVFIDYEGIPSGHFEFAIVSNILSRAHFVVILTPTALERCDDPNDWLRREIETAMQSRRNIVPLLLNGFKFDAPIALSRLQGPLKPLSEYQALPIPNGGLYFDAAMTRLRDNYLSVVVEGRPPRDDSAQEREDADRQQRATMQVAALTRTDGSEPVGPPTSPERRPQSAVEPNPPTTKTLFVGRERDKADIVGSLSNRLITITGAAGMGKTRMAQEVGQAVWQKYHGFAWWVTLDGLDEGTSVTAIVAAALGLHSQESATRSIVAYLADKTALLVLDPCERLLDACVEFAAAVLRDCPGVTILAASEELLGDALSEEVLWTLQPLTFAADPDRVRTVQELEGFEAVQLFKERARLVDREFTINEDNKRVVAQLCERVAGMPLAIELMAKLKRNRSVQEILSDYDRDFGRFAGQSTGRLQTVINLSHDRLEAAERILFHRLAVFAGSFTLEAVNAICAGVPVPAGGVTDVLRRLHDKSLILRTEQDGHSRFSLLAPLRQFALHRLRVPAADPLQAALSAAAGIDETELRRRHAEYFLRVALEAEAKHRTAERSQARAQIQAEIIELRAAFRASVASGSAVTMLRLAGAMCWYWNQSSQWAIGEEWLDRALRACTGAEPAEAKAHALYGRGRLHWLLGDYLLARTEIDSSIAIWRSLGDPGREGLAHALVIRGSIAQDGEEGADAARSFREESRIVFHAAGSLWGEALALLDLGKAEWQEDRPDLLERARALYRDGLELFGHTGDDWGIGIASGYLAYSDYVFHDLERARLGGEEALRRLRSSDDKGALTDVLINLGQVLLEQGDPGARTRFREVHAEAVEFARQLDHRGFLGVLEQQQRNFEGRGTGP